VIAILERWTRGRAGAGRSDKLRSVGRSHVGRVRTVNEDRILERSDRGLWAVADGMGGHRAGDRAATIAVDALAARADDPRPLDRVRLLEAFRAADASIAAETAGGASGTTVVACWAAGARATLFWAGDSRAYRASASGAVELLTHDHSLVQQMVDAGTLDADDAAAHPKSNVVTRALGIEGLGVVETRGVALAPGDRLLLCSDGLSRSLDPRDLRPDLSLEDQADRLLLNALRRDGGDNTSLVLIG
jgi:serine/threonine-protein phosphatase Stp1